MKGEKIKTKLKVNDNVVVISGAESGKRGKILKVDRVRGRVIIEGINKRNNNFVILIIYSIYFLLLYLVHHFCVCL